MPPRIENPQSFSLAPSTIAILQEMFQDYQRVIINDDFSSSGYSGSNIYVVQAIRQDGMPALPTVVKIASISLIQQECQAYQKHIRDSLPNASKIRGSPVLCEESGYGGLCYDLFGEGTFEIKPLKEYASCADIQDLRFVLDEQLLPSMRQIWNFRCQTQAGIPLQVCYDQVLPVNLRIKHTPLPPEAKPVLIRPGTAPPVVQVGDFVQLEGFIVIKTNLEGQTIKLNWPKSETGPLRSYFVKLESIEGMNACQVNQSFPTITGQVVETRLGRLDKEVDKVLGQEIDLTAPELNLPDGRTLPNPLQTLPDILNQTRHIWKSHIHGDLNLGNILVELGTRKIGLIDFAEARVDYVLHDFLRLETEVITHLVAKIIHQHKLPLASTICCLYQHLHDIIFDQEPTMHEPPHPDLERPLVILTTVRQAMQRYLFERYDYTEYYQGLIPYLLGALKFDNLDDAPEAPAPKQAAFWGAAAAQKLLQGDNLLIDDHPNPFVVVGRITNPKHFFDRKEQLQGIFEYLAKGTNISLVGKAKIGKSSILSMICKLGPDRLNWPEQAFIYLDLQCACNEHDFFEELCYRLSIEICRGFKLRRALHKKLCGLYGKHYILCLDEMEKLNCKGFSIDLRAELRGLSDGDDAPLTLVTASRRPLTDLFLDSTEKTSALANIFYHKDVKAFSPDVATDFLTHRLRGTGVIFTERDIQTLLTKSDCEPAKLQKEAEKLFKRYQRRT